jgi:hypothetical protein
MFKRRPKIRGIVSIIVAAFLISLTLFSVGSLGLMQLFLTRSKVKNALYNYINTEKKITSIGVGNAITPVLLGQCSYSNLSIQSTSVSLTVNCPNLIPFLNIGSSIPIAIQETIPTSSNNNNNNGNGNHGSDQENSDDEND